MSHFRHVAAPKSLTLQQVAQAAGVSPSAASVILNGAKSGTRVSVATRRSVLETASRLGYRPNEVARSLATGRSNRVGVYSGRTQLDCRNPFFAEVLGGVFEGASEHQLDTVVHTSGRDEGRLIDLVRGRSVDGLIVHSDPIDPILSLLGDLLIPTVVIADITDGLPSVTVDDVAGGTLLAQHLGSCGHRHVMIKQAPFPSRSAVNRVEAFASTAERLGVKVSWSVEATDGTGRLSADDLRTLTEGRDRATAIMAWSQNVAERTCRSLDAVGISIPGSVAVVGFDGFHQQYQPKFDITTVQAPWAEVGRVALNHLMTLISGESIPLLTTLPVSFYHGSTT